MKKPNKYWDRAWSLVEGCTPCSPGCDHCWSAAMAARFGKSDDLVSEAGAYSGRVVFRGDRLHIPYNARKPAVWSIWTDLFHEDVDPDNIAAAFDMMRMAHDQTFLVLTKRAKRMFEFLDGTALKFPNVWLGVTVCNQAEADEKIPFLLETPAEHRFVSVEPMLEPIFLRRHFRHWMAEIDWVVCGPETGPGKRPFDPKWAAQISDECQDARVQFFYKGVADIALPRELPWVWVG